VILTIVALLVAVGAGLAVNYLVGVMSDKEATEGASVTAVLGSTALLSAFIVALVLANTAGTYSSAARAAKQEADVVDNLYEAAEYIEQPHRQAIHAAAVCYARAIINFEWDELAGGGRSTVPNNWTGTGPNGIRRTLIQMGPAARGFSLVQSADQRRGELRNERVVQAGGNVPEVLYWFMIILVAISLGSLAYSVPRAKNTGQLVALFVVATLFICAVLLLRNLDRPFAGVLAQDPSDMQTTEQDIAEDYADAYGATLPCDDLGEPLAAR
jgi:cytochrome bd-type quinol oxidase subunit 2